MRKLSAIVLILILLGATVGCWGGDLLTYVQSPDASFKWEKVSQADETLGTRYLLKMISQTWHDIVWTHDIEVFRPAKCDYPKTAFLFVTGGKPGGGESRMMGLIAAGIGCPMAILYGIPNQPLFDGKREDALIAHTFVKTVETGDDTWPLLFPMARSAVRAMDALQAFSKSELKEEITGFVVSGASKRGWTTWLTAAADPVRVRGIVPMVYDNLNLAAQMPHQIRTWGKYSEMIGDYTQRGLQDRLKTPEGKHLGEIVDPWTYRDRITMPKLIVNGTNDPYWTQDALNLYWDDLKGPKYVLYVPNAGHNLKDLGRVIASSSAFTRAIASGSELPKVTWKFTSEGGAERLDIAADPAAASAKLWTAKSDTRDFRTATWESTPMTAGGGFTGTVPFPGKGYVAMFGEVSVTMGGKDCTLSTQIRILDARGAVLPDRN